jgi:hypothetical protein
MADMSDYYVFYSAGKPLTILMDEIAYFPANKTCFFPKNVT